MGQGENMSNELSILMLYGLLTVVVILVQVLAAAGQVGLPMLATPRDDMPKLTGVAGRLDRAQKNSIVAMVLFAPPVLVLALKSGFTAQSLMAAQIFLIARVLYIGVYVMGTPWLRTLVWIAGFLSTVWLYFLAM
jgi:uncharacterized MAPEG superfamily protein